MEVLKNHWFWIGPILGGLCAVIFQIIKKQIEEFLLKRRFKHDFLSILLKDLDDFYALMEKPNISRMQEHIKNANESINNWTSSLQVWFLQNWSYLLPQLVLLKPNLNSIANYLSDPNIQEQQMITFFQRYINNQESFSSEKEWQTAEALNQIQKWIHAFR
ncbi:MAG: hypothetical protein HZB61_05455 [Nitrospirae bacterium]|nr:hypothetical protein [Nitrospirota bacterium]